MSETLSRRSLAQWPAHLPVGATRWARSSGRYAETVRFYRDLVGLPVVGSFSGSYGEDGTIFGLPDTATQLEIVCATGPSDPADPFDQLVLYLPGADALSEATRALRDEGLEPHPAPHAYWAANGAVQYVDPDGRGVVYAPWIYGVQPDPVDRPDSGLGQPRVELYHGDRADLLPLFELAEDSPTELDAYLQAGRVLVAVDGDRTLGHLQLVETLRPAEVELKNMAVREDLQGRGVGRLLVRAAIDLVGSEGASTMVVATAAADLGNLRFYQRQGFRMRSVEPNAFTADTGYPDGIIIDGIPLRDRVWLARALPA